MEQHGAAVAVEKRSRSNRYRANGANRNATGKTRREPDQVVERRVGHGVKVPAAGVQRAATDWWASG